jgi:hypothetical protein
MLDRYLLYVKYECEYWHWQPCYRRLAADAEDTVRAHGGFLASGRCCRDPSAILTSFPFIVTGKEEDTLRPPHHSRAMVDLDHESVLGSVGEPLIIRGQAKSRPHVRRTSIARPSIPTL